MKPSKIIIVSLVHGGSYILFEKYLTVMKACAYFCRYHLQVRFLDGKSKTKIVVEPVRKDLFSLFKET